MSRKRREKRRKKTHQCEGVERASGRDGETGGQAGRQACVNINSDINTQREEEEARRLVVYKY